MVFSCVDPEADPPVLLNGVAKFTNKERIQQRNSLNENSNEMFALIRNPVKHVKLVL